MDLKLTSMSDLYFRLSSLNDYLKAIYIYFISCQLTKWNFWANRKPHGQIARERNIASIIYERVPVRSLFQMAHAYSTNLVIRDELQLYSTAFETTYQVVLVHIVWCAFIYMGNIVMIYIFKTILLNRSVMFLFFIKYIKWGLHQNLTNLCFSIWINCLSALFKYVIYKLIKLKLERGEQEENSEKKNNFIKRSWSVLTSINKHHFEFSVNSFKKNVCTTCIYMLQW